MADSLADLLALVEYQRTKKERAQQRELQNQQTAKLKEFMSGAKSPESSPLFFPMFSAGKSSIEDQFAETKDNVLGGMARGGQQLGALADLETERAKSVGSLPAMISSNIVGDMMNKAYGAAFGSPSSTTPVNTMMGTVASKEMANINSKAMEDQLYYGGLGNLASMFLMQPNQPGTGAPGATPAPWWNVSGVPNGGFNYPQLNW